LTEVTCWGQKYHVVAGRSGCAGVKQQPEWLSAERESSMQQWEGLRVVARTGQMQTASSPRPSSCSHSQGVRRRKGLFLRETCCSHCPTPRFWGCSKKQRHRVTWHTDESGKETAAPGRIAQELGMVQCGLGWQPRTLASWVAFKGRCLGPPV
jgi:hypothetical protein